MKISPSYNLEWLEKKLTFGFSGKSLGPQSSADKAAGGFRPSGSIQARKQVNAANPHKDAATPQGQRSAVTSQQTADRNTIRRADSSARQAATSKRRYMQRSLLNEKRLSDTLG